MPSENTYNVIIAAIPLMALTLVAAALVALAAAHRRHWRSLSGNAPAAPLALDAAPAATAVSLREGAPIYELRFEGLSCAVPLPRRWTWPWCKRPTVAPVAAAAASNGTNGKQAGSLARAPSLESGWVKEEASPAAAAAEAQQQPAMKQLLRDVSGYARRGELVGVLGPSGACCLQACVPLAVLLLLLAPAACSTAAPRRRLPSCAHTSLPSSPPRDPLCTGGGKTTLLALLCASQEYVSKGAHVTGTILMDGRPMDAAAHSKVTALLPLHPTAGRSRLRSLQNRLGDPPPCWPCAPSPVPHAPLVPPPPGSWHSCRPTTRCCRH